MKEQVVNSGGENRNATVVPFHDKNLLQVATDVPTLIPSRCKFNGSGPDELA
jgi:hypothetical protein